MSDQLSMFGPMTSQDTPNATSSPAAGSGPLPSGSPAGPTTGPAGPEAAPAPVSRQRAKDQGLMTLATSGRLGRNSSASESLQRSLESRLMMRLDMAGSTLFKLTWKRRRTPLGRSYLERAVSAARTSGKGFTSWPTPQVQDMSGGGQAKRASEERHGSNLNDFALLASWATPRNEDAESAGMRHGRGVADTLTAQTSLAGWSTPSARDWKDSEGMAETGTNPDGSERTRLDQLPRQANLAAWTTQEQKTTDPLVAYGVEVARREGWEAFGIMLISSTAEIRIVPGSGQLRAGHSRWLMAIPAAWDDFASMAMQSMSKLRKRSSKA
jgi:hypothetical protein